MPQTPLRHRERKLFVYDAIDKKTIRDRNTAQLYITLQNMCFLAIAVNIIIVMIGAVIVIIVSDLFF